MDPPGNGHGSRTLGNQCSTATDLSDYMSLMTDHNPKFCMTFKMIHDKGELHHT
jgi:hypothetical protein